MCVPFVCFFSITTSPSPTTTSPCTLFVSSSLVTTWSLKRPPDREGLPEAADGVPVEEGRRQEAQEGRQKKGRSQEARQVGAALARGAQPHLARHGARLGARYFEGTAAEFDGSASGDMRCRRRTHLPRSHAVWSQT